MKKLIFNLKAISFIFVIYYLVSVFFVFYYILFANMKLEYFSWGVIHLVAFYFGMFFLSFGLLANVLFYFRAKFSDRLFYIFAVFFSAIAILLNFGEAYNSGFFITFTTTLGMILIYSFLLIKWVKPLYS